MGAGTPERVSSKPKSEKHQEEMLSPPKRENVYETSQQENNEEVQFQWYKKLSTLPRVNAEVRHVSVLYEQMKTNFKYIGICCDVTQWLVFKFWSLLMVILFTQPITDLTYNVMRKVKFWDDFTCHQLDFVEAKLRNIDTRVIYKPGGLADRFIILIRLCLRLTFFFPRITLAMMAACYAVLTDEIMTNITLLVSLFEMPKQRRSKRSKETMKKSPGKKRKHEDETPSGLPDYFVTVNYEEASDPDYEPSDDDTEVTSASEHSHSESDGEEKEEVKIKSPKKLIENNSVENVPSVEEELVR